MPVVLGQGQMGTVYLAADPLIDRPVAVKVLRSRPEFDRDEDEYVPLEELKRTDYETWSRLMQGGYEALFEEALELDPVNPDIKISIVSGDGITGDDGVIVCPYVCCVENIEEAVKFEIRMRGQPN